jgi:hypothetical protein
MTISSPQMLLKQWDAFFKEVAHSLALRVAVA